MGVCTFTPRKRGFKVVFQVKTSPKVSRAQVAQFLQDMRSDKADLGYFIGFDFTKGAKQEALEAGRIEQGSVQQSVVTLVSAYDLVGDNPQRLTLRHVYSERQQAEKKGKAQRNLLDANL